METFVSVGIGLCLAAACGLRVFLPLAGLSIASATGQIHLAPSFAVLATPAASIALVTATLAEIAAYYVPWLDHALDTLATPAAVVAGILATGAVTGDLPPLIRWAIALIGGGGAAGLLQGATVLLRLKSTTLTGGIGNSVVATGEAIGSATLVLLALLIPIAGLIFVLFLLVASFRGVGRILFGRTAAKQAAGRA